MTPRPNNVGIQPNFGHRSRAQTPIQPSQFRLEIYEQHCTYNLTEYYSTTPDNLSAEVDYISVSKCQRSLQLYKEHFSVHIHLSIHHAHSAWEETVPSPPWGGTRPERLPPVIGRCGWSSSPSSKGPPPNDDVIHRPMTEMLQW